jgi:hypothetical protein
MVRRPFSATCSPKEEMVEVKRAEATGEAATYPSWKLGRKSTSEEQTAMRFSSQFMARSTAQPAIPAALRKAVR